MTWQITEKDEQTARGLYELESAGWLTRWSPGNVLMDATLLGPHALYDLQYLPLAHR
jgi:hypothetical protein